MRIQIWTALIAMLLLRYLPLKSPRVLELFHSARQEIFVYRDLWKLLNPPDRPPTEADVTHLNFARQS